MDYTIYYKTSKGECKEHTFYADETNSYPGDISCMMTALIPFIKENDIVEINDVAVDEEEWDD